MINHPELAHLNDHLAPRPQRPGVYIIECPACGYEPDEQQILRPMRCPKCHRFTWRQRPRPGMLAGKLVGQPDATTS